LPVTSRILTRSEFIQEVIDHQKFLEIHGMSLDKITTELWYMFDSADSLVEWVMHTAPTCLEFKYLDQEETEFFEVVSTRNDPSFEERRQTELSKLQIYVEAGCIIIVVADGNNLIIPPSPDDPNQLEKTRLEIAAVQNGTWVKSDSTILTEDVVHQLQHPLDVPEVEEE